jgi:hypothetical protein
VFYFISVDPYFPSSFSSSLLAYFPYFEKNKRMLISSYFLSVYLPYFFVFCAVRAVSKESRRLVLPITFCFYYFFLFQLPHYFLSLFFLPFFCLILLSLPIFLLFLLYLLFNLYSHSVSSFTPSSSSSFPPPILPFLLLFLFSVLT